MLVLVRRREESLVIRGDIVVTVLGVEGDRVKLGIDAPREISILRRELCEQVSTENRAAAQSTPDIHTILPTLKKSLISRKPPT